MVGEGTGVCVPDLGRGACPAAAPPLPAAGLALTGLGADAGFAVTSAGLLPAHQQNLCQSTLQLQYPMTLLRLHWGSCQLQA